MIILKDEQYHNNIEPLLNTWKLRNLASQETWMVTFLGNNNLRRCCFWFGLRGWVHQISIMGACRQIGRCINRTWIGAATHSTICKQNLKGKQGLRILTSREEAGPQWTLCPTIWAQNILKKKGWWQAPHAQHQKVLAEGRFGSGDSREYDFIFPTHFCLISFSYLLLDFIYFSILHPYSMKLENRIEDHVQTIALKKTYDIFNVCFLLPFTKEVFHL